MMNGNDSFFKWLVSIAGIQNPPLVHSVSYGEDYDTISNASQTRCNQEFIKMGAMGVSFIFAAGDYGVNCDPEGDFNVPVFPAGSPFVTSVGGIKALTFFIFHRDLLSSSSTSTTPRLVQ